MATQAEVDQLTQEVSSVKENLAKARVNIEERFAALEKALGEGKTGGEVDLTGLKAAVEGLAAPSTELENIEPVKAAPVPPSGQAPTNPDGTAAAHTTEPPANTAATTAAEDAARATV